MNDIIGWLTWLLVDAALLLAPAPAPPPCDLYDGRHLTECGIEHVVDAAGWPPHLHDDAVTLAMCESSGLPTARGDNGVSVGLFQIHTPSWGRTIGQRDLTDPITNASIALDIYRQQGRDAWWRCVRKHHLFDESRTQ